MRTLQFSIDGQNLAKNGDFDHIIRGTKHYLNCQFKFNGNDWARCKAVAVFEIGSKEFPVGIASDGTCMVPDDVTDNKTFKVRVIGVRDNDYRVVTNRVLISQEG